MDDAKASCDVELPVLAVSQLAEIVRDGLHSIFPDDLWVEGQISGFHDARPPAHPFREGRPARLNIWLNFHIKLNMFPLILL